MGSFDLGKSSNQFEGRLVRLRAVRGSDWELFHQNDLDSESARASHFVTPPRSPEATRKWAEEVSARDPLSHERHFAIETLAGELVGGTNAHRCDPRNGTFWYGLALFRPHWRKGYGREAILLLLRYYFEELGYQKANAGVYAFNEASIRLHATLGFQREGLLRRNYLTGGEYHDEILFGLTVEEFRAAQ